MTSGHRPKHAAPPRPGNSDADRGMPGNDGAGNDGPKSWATTTAQEEAAASMSGESGSADRAAVFPATVFPAAAFPATADPATADQDMTDRGRADPRRADRGRADPGSTDPGSTDLGSTEPGSTGPGSTETGSTDPGSTEPGSTETGTEAEPVTAQLAAVRPVPVAHADGQFGAPLPQPDDAGPAPAELAARQRGSVQAGPARQARRSESKLRLVWVYPDLLSTYGDRGNLLVLERRAGLRGIEVESFEVNADQRVPRQGDIYLMGGGEDLPQILAARRLRADGGLAAAAERGAVLLAVCAGYQIVGTEFGGVDGEPEQGLGILNIRSGRGERRGVGEIVADVDPALGVPRLTGFENHQGVTSLGSGVRPLARVVMGVGNGDGTEGAYAGTVLGTYLHGPALVRNPGLADLLLTWATGPLEPLDSADESWARRLREERLAAVS